MNFSKTFPKMSYQMRQRASRTVRYGISCITFKRMQRSLSSINLKNTTAASLPTAWAWARPSPHLRSSSITRTGIKPFLCFARKSLPILRRSLFQKRETPLLLIRSSAHLPRRVASCVDCGTEGVFAQRYLGEDHRLAPGMGRSDLYNGEIPPNCSYKRLLRITPPAAHRRSCFGA